MPFLIQCSTYFLKRLGHFLWKGMKPFPALTAFDLFFKAVRTFFEEGHEALPCTDSVRPIFQSG